MVLTNMVAIKNYEAGKNGNMLISLDVNLELNTRYTCKERNVKPLLCTVFINNDDTEALELLEQRVDKDTPCNKVIVISKEFLKLSNKKQLALLEIQNQAVMVDNPENNLEQRVYGEYCAIEKFGKRIAKSAMRKENKFRTKSLMKAASGAHSQYKKEVRAEKKLNKAAKKAEEAINKVCPDCAPSEA